MLTMQQVYDHLGIDDPEDADSTVRLYVQAAIRAAEQYSGQPLSARQVIDVVENPKGMSFPIKGRPSGPIVAKVYVVGQQPKTFTARHANGRVVLPVNIECGATALELSYRVGPAQPLPAHTVSRSACGDVTVASTIDTAIVDADPMVELGILTFVAHAYTHRGDSPASWADDSGALDYWRPQRGWAFG